MTEPCKMRADRTRGRCWLCARDDQVLTDEHVLAESHFGARLVAPKCACARCNSLSGKVERLVAEHPFVGEAIADIRTDGAPNPRPNPQAKGRLPDGSYVQVKLGRDGSHATHLIPRRIDTDSDGTEVWAVEEGTETTFEERRTRRGERVRAIGRPLKAARPAEIQYDIGVDNVDAWDRFLAKITLSVASLVFDPGWMDSSDAVKLRHFFQRWPLRDGRRFSPFGAIEQDRSQPPWSLLYPDHLLELLPNDSGGTRLLLALFGYLGGQVDLIETGCPAEGVAWIIPSDFKRPTRYSLAELRAELESR